jgi:glycosyltransferase involved in cell wall biosynthesis
MAAAIQPDIFHVHEPDLLGPVLREAGSRPVIYDVHEYFIDVLGASPWMPRWLSPIVSCAWDYWERRLVRRCAGVITVTEPIARRYVTLNPNVRVVANYPDRESVDTQFLMERDGKTCVMAGSINPTRGLRQNFEALAVLKQRGLVIRLALAGSAISDEYLTSVLAEAERLGVRQQVEYHGILSKDEAMRFQQMADIGLVTYLPFGGCVHALPSKLLECMALGLPVVCSDFPVIREVAGNGAGILVDPADPLEIADAIERLVRNPEQAKEMGDIGRRAVRERFNWNVEQDKLLGLYQQVLNEHSHSKTAPVKLCDEVI